MIRENIQRHLDETSTERIGRMDIVRARESQEEKGEKHENSRVVRAGESMERQQESKTARK